MNLKIVLLGISLMAASYAKAASSSSMLSAEYPGKLSLGLQAGLDFQSAETPAQISSNSYTGFSVGANLDIPLTPHLSLQPEINYVRRGLTLVSAGNATAKVYYHSLELPAFAKVSFGESVRPYLFAGPMAIANISTSVEGIIGGSSASTSFDPKTIDFAGVAGVGIQAGAFFANARYVLGLTNLSNNSADWYSRGFRIMAGVQL